MCWSNTLKEHSYNTQGTLRANSENPQGTLSKHTENTQSTFREHPENTQETPRENSENTQGTLSKHAENAQRTLSKHSENTERTLREHFVLWSNQVHRNHREASLEAGISNVLQSTCWLTDSETLCTDPHCVFKIVRGKVTEIYG